VTAEEKVGFGHVRIRRARTGEIDEVLAVLDEAAAWLARRGIEQWPSRFEHQWVRGGLGSKETWLALDGDRAVGTVQLAAADPIWDDRPGPAGYVHRLAVRREAAGLGRVLVEWASAESSRHGGAFLRLDCVAHNPGLRRYYENLGFAHAGDVEVGGPPGDRASGVPTVLVARYERPITGGGS